MINYKRSVFKQTIAFQGFLVSALEKNMGKIIRNEEKKMQKWIWGRRTFFFFIFKMPSLLCLLFERGSHKRGWGCRFLEIRRVNGQTVNSNQFFDVFNMKLIRKVSIIFYYLETINDSPVPTGKLLELGSHHNFVLTAFCYCFAVVVLS